MTKTITELVVGDQFSTEGALVLMVSSVKVQKSQRGEYFQLTFQDKSGSMNGVMWEIPSSLKDLPEICAAQEGVVAHFLGDVTEFKGTKQLTAKRLILVPEEEVDPTNFVPVVTHDRGEMWQEIRRLIAEVKDPEYKSLLVAVFNDVEVRNNFVSGIGGVYHHHNYIGGLMEHTLQVTRIALGAIDAPFAFPNLNRDLIITGGILHDIGKTKEYLFTKAISYNTNAIEHRYEGVAMLDLIIYKNELSIAPEKLKLVKNIIMSHHGSFGDASIKIESPEGVVIHHSDCISAFVNGHFVKGGN